MHDDKVISKPKDTKKTIKKLLSSLKEYRFSLIITFAFAIGSTVFAIVGPKILGNATTEIFKGLVGKVSGGSGIDFASIANILIFLIILYVISLVFGFIQGIIMSNVSQKYTYDLRKKVGEKINKLPMAYFEKRSHGETLSVLTNDIDVINTSLNQNSAQTISAITTVVGILVMMLSINVVMTLIALIILPISGFLLGKIIKMSQKHFKNQQEYLGHVNGGVEEMFSGHSVIKVYNAEKKMLEIFNHNNEKLAESVWKSQFLSGLMYPIMTLIGNIAYVAVALIGGYLAIKGKITVGNIQSFITYNRQFTQPLGQIAQASTALQGMIAGAERVFDFLEEEEESYEAHPEVIQKLEGNVEFKNVKFGYNENQVIINDFSAKIPHGKTIAIVGPTGAGKTTIVKLLMRFYNVLEGEILIDGKNINKLSRKELRKIFGMVLQDTWLFNGSVMDNLRYGKLDATDDEVIEAAKKAHVHHFIQTLPDGYNMELNEETNNISGGQKQLLTIARAILADPKIMILDEATSSVDTRTEILIQKAMDQLMVGRTTFIIAHRLSTIKNADTIIVMNEGDIVEQGNHKELLKKNGFYANLYNSQFENN